MAEKKEKKVTAREKFMKESAQMFMDALGMDAVYRTKEGLLFDVGEEQVVVKFIQKKSRVTQEDILETIMSEGSDFDLDVVADEEEEVEDWVEDEVEVVEEAV
jgi:hypothetical protein